MIPSIDHHIAADLFCGAGGTSTGLLEAAQSLGLPVKLIAVNHWQVAIATHSQNHPFADHYCEAVENLDPCKVVPGGYLRLLVASPECRFHSTARGGRPINDQLRTSPWDILRWMEALYIEDVLIENVPDFVDWGPLDEHGHKVNAQKGKIFLQYLRCIRALGYRVDYRTLLAADYGDPTTRKRLFIICRRKRRIAWPDPTHTGNLEQAQLDGRNLAPWRTARDIIDWSERGQSIYNRKRPLADNTLRRIAVGLRKLSGLPFVIGQQSGAAPRSVDEPLPTVATAGALACVQPFLIQMNGTSERQLAMRSVDDPMPTVATANQHALVQPYLVKYYGSGDGAVSVDEPLPTVTTKDRFGLVEPLIFQIGNQSYMLDILFRMLLPRELAAAQGFPPDYQFTGKREDVVRQIGNAVPCNLARALCRSLLADSRHGGRHAEV